VTAPHARPDRGMSLVETLVGMGIATIVLAAVGTLFAGSVASVRSVSVTTATGAEVRVGMDAMTRTLRTAALPRGLTGAFVVADTGRMSFYALLNRSGAAQGTDTVPTRVDYSYDGTCVNQTQTPSTAVANPPPAGPLFTWTGPGQTSCLVRTSTAPVFRYFATGAISSGGVTNPPLTVPAGGITDAPTLASIQSVELLLTGSDPANPQVGAVPLLGRVTLTNVLTAPGGV